VASLAGEVGQRKMIATRIGNKVLNELKVMGQLQSTGQSGVVQESGLSYKWSLRSELWTEDTLTPMNLITLIVAYRAQGKNYDVRLSTLMAQNNR